LDIGKGLPIDLPVLQHRIVATGHDVIGAERFEGAQERWLRAVAHGVVIEPPGGDARRLGEVRMASWALTLFVETVHQHRDRAAEMGHDEFYSRIAVRDLLSDHMQHKSRVLERGAD